MLIDDLHANAESLAGHPAVVCGEEELSWADLRERVVRLAGGLLSTGIGPGDPVALLLPNSPQFVISALAITALGGVVVPLNPQFKREELEFLFRDAGVRAVIGTDETAATTARIVEPWDRRVPVITTGTRTGAAHPWHELLDGATERDLGRRAPEEDFVFQFSSGSTGRPKRVPRTHGQCWAEAESYTTTLDIGPSDRIFCVIPLFHTYGQGMCLLTFVRTGATLVIMEEPNPFVLQRGRALDLLERHSVTIFPGVPFNFRLPAE